MSSEFDAAKHTFASESSELLHEMEYALLHLENSPDDKDVINALFRAAHTIKGSSGIIGIETVERFTHVVENVLERVRREEIKITSHLIELLLRCRDHISVLVSHAVSEKSFDHTVKTLEQSLLKELSNYLDLKEDTAKPACPSSQSSPQRGEAGTHPQGWVGEGGSNANWRISLKFGRDCIRNGMDPISFINYLTKLGEGSNIVYKLFDQIGGDNKPNYLV
ncbi:MAG: Hpt domain-containing protein [Deltaproteobacteria bacterium]|nr:Hpt domain-containing protein [Deltaproteobacteria bacterium]